MPNACMLCGMMYPAVTSFSACLSFCNASRVCQGLADNVHKQHTCMNQMSLTVRGFWKLGDPLGLGIKGIPQVSDEPHR